MNLKQLFVAAPAALLMLGGGAAKAGQTIDDVGLVRLRCPGNRLRKRPRPRFC